MRDPIGSIQSKVVFGPWCDIFPNNLKEQIAIVRRLHVMEAECVNKLVNNRVETEASILNRVWLEFYCLNSPNLAHIRRAAGSIAAYLNVITFGRLVNKLKAV